MGEVMAKDIKKVKLYMKHNDTACIECYADDDDCIIDQDGYMPYVGILGGDETELTIDNETGQIIGWKPIKTVEFPSEED